MPDKETILSYQDKHPVAGHQYTVRDYLHTPYQMKQLGFHHVMFYKSVLPYPLRESFRKLRVLEATKIGDGVTLQGRDRRPLSAIALEQVKVDSVRQFVRVKKEMFEKKDEYPRRSTKASSKAKVKP